MSRPRSPSSSSRPRRAQETQPPQQGGSSRMGMCRMAAHRAVRDAIDTEGSVRISWDRQVPGMHGCYATAAFLCEHVRVVAR